MTFLTWLALLLVAIGAVVAGRLDVALLCAGVKTLLVGLQFMELRHSARVHAAVFVIWVVLTTGLLLFTR